MVAEGGGGGSLGGSRTMRCCCLWELAVVGGDGVEADGTNAMGSWGLLPIMKRKRWLLAREAVVLVMVAGVDGGS